VNARDEHGVVHCEAEWLIHGHAIRRPFCGATGELVEESSEKPVTCLQCAARAAEEAARLLVAES
jgi:hypothetical protein